MEFNKRLVEVNEILNYLPEEELIKIPENVRNKIKENMDKEYKWKFDETKELKDQNVSCDTIAILSYLNMEYLLNKEQKELMNQFHELNENIIEKSDIGKVGIEELFKKNDIVKKEEINNNTNSMVEYKESGFKKFINMLKKILKIK